MNIIIVFVDSPGNLARVIQRAGVPQISAPPPPWAPMTAAMQKGYAAPVANANSPHTYPKQNGGYAVQLAKQMYQKELRRKNHLATQEQTLFIDLRW